jgi:NhaP-type Na+/H+ or K+/H+ antiporter
VAFIGWFGPRGLASIVFLVIAIEGLHAGEPETEVLTAAIGWTVLLSVVLHGLSAAPLARRYGRMIAGLPRDIPEREPADEPRPATMHWAGDALGRRSGESDEGQG